MKYSEVRPGLFVSRPNRFVALVDLDGGRIAAHVKNTGRCRELLVPGCEVWLEKAAGTDRRTAYDLVAVRKILPDGRSLLVNMDSQMPNEAAAEWLPGSGLLPEGAEIHREVRYRDSRFDFYMEGGGRRIFCEVKGVTLEEEGRALFPDAPTVRGIKHLRELTAALGDGFEAWILFVIQMEGVRVFSPNDAAHPEFGRALRDAVGAGVRVLAVDSRVTPDGLTIRGPVEIAIKLR